MTAITPSSIIQWYIYFCFSVMFWTDWNRDNPKIERSNMDGTERVTLVSEGLGLPNGLTLDTENQRVCWADAGKVESFTGQGSL